jgi:hypothetical protein
VQHVQSELARGRDGPALLQNPPPLAGDVDIESLRAEDPWVAILADGRIGDVAIFSDRSPGPPRPGSR